MSDLDERMDAWGREQARRDGVPEDEAEVYSTAMQKTLLGEATRLHMARDDFLVSVARPLRPFVRRVLGPDPLEYAERKRDEFPTRRGADPMSTDQERQLLALAKDIAYVEDVPVGEAVARIRRALTDPVEPLQKTGPKGDPMTHTLTEFLLARFTEDEATARNATGGSWVGAFKQVTSEGIGSTVIVASTHRAQDSHHIERWDPERVLRRCKADREIVAACSAADTMLGDDVLRALAVPYADHPDYREEWRP